MTPFEDFLPHVLPVAPSVPEPLAIIALRNAAIEFCQRSRSWRKVTEIAVIGDEYEIAPVPANATLFEIEKAWFKIGTDDWGDPLKRISYSDIDPNLIPQAGDTPTGAPPEYISQVDYDTVIVFPIAEGTLRISMFLVPSQSAEVAPDFLYDKHAREIADGALASILMTPDQPYTNTNLAVVKHQMFDAFCNHKFNQNIRGQQRAPTRVRASYF